METAQSREVAAAPTAEEPKASLKGPSERKPVRKVVKFGVCMLVVGVLGTIFGVVTWVTLNRQQRQITPTVTRVHVDAPYGADHVQVHVGIGLQLPETRLHGIAITGGVCSLFGTCGGRPCTVATADLSRVTYHSEDSLGIIADIDADPSKLQDAGELKAKCDLEVDVDYYSTGITSDHGYSFTMDLGSAVAGTPQGETQSLRNLTVWFEPETPTLSIKPRIKQNTSSTLPGRVFMKLPDTLGKTAHKYLTTAAVSLNIGVGMEDVTVNAFDITARIRGTLHHTGNGDDTPLTISFPLEVGSRVDVPALATLTMGVVRGTATRKGISSHGSRNHTVHLAAKEGLGARVLGKDHVVGWQTQGHDVEDLYHQAVRFAKTLETTMPHSSRRLQQAAPSLSLAPARKLEEDMTPLHMGIRIFADDEWTGLTIAASDEPSVLKWDFKVENPQGQLFRISLYMRTEDGFMTAEGFIFNEEEDELSGISLQLTDGEDSLIINGNTYDMDGPQVIWKAEVGSHDDTVSLSAELHTQEFSGSFYGSITSEDGTTTIWAEVYDGDEKVVGGMVNVEDKDDSVTVGASVSDSEKDVLIVTLTESHLDNGTRFSARIDDSDGLLFSGFVEGTSRDTVESIAGGTHKGTALGGRVYLMDNEEARILDVRSYLDDAYDSLEGGVSVYGESDDAPQIELGLNVSKIDGEISFDFDGASYSLDFIIRDQDDLRADPPMVSIGLSGFISSDFKLDADAKISDSSFGKVAVNVITEPDLVFDAVVHKDEDDKLVTTLEFKWVEGTNQLAYEQFVYDDSMARTFGVSFGTYGANSLPFHAPNFSVALRVQTEGDEVPLHFNVSAYDYPEDFLLEAMVDISDLKLLGSVGKQNSLGVANGTSISVRANVSDAGDNHTVLGALSVELVENDNAVTNDGIFTLGGGHGEWLILSFHAKEANSRRLAASHGPPADRHLAARRLAPGLDNMDFYFDLKVLDQEDLAEQILHANVSYFSEFGEDWNEYHIDFNLDNESHPVGSVAIYLYNDPEAFRLSFVPAKMDLPPDDSSLRSLSVTFEVGKDTMDDGALQNLTLEVEGVCRNQDTCAVLHLLGGKGEDGVYYGHVQVAQDRDEGEEAGFDEQTIFDAGFQLFDSEEYKQGNLSISLDDNATLKEKMRVGLELKNWQDDEKNIMLTVKVDENHTLMTKLAVNGTYNESSEELAASIHLIEMFEEDDGTKVDGSGDLGGEFSSELDTKNLWLSVYKGSERVFAWDIYVDDTSEEKWIYNEVWTDSEDENDSPDLSVWLSGSDDDPDWLSGHMRVWDEDYDSLLGVDGYIAQTEHTPSLLLSTGVKTDDYEYLFVNLMINGSWLPGEDGSTHNGAAFMLTTDVDNHEKGEYFSMGDGDEFFSANFTTRRTPEEEFQQTKVQFDVWELHDGLQKDTKFYVKWFVDAPMEESYAMTQPDFERVDLEPPEVPAPWFTTAEPETPDPTTAPGCIAIKKTRVQEVEEMLNVKFRTCNPPGRM